jgi:diguanylate cyclase (GGDEF)-like protein
LNSRKGYPAGDQVLLLVTQVLKDPRHNFEFAARLGDDRFAVVVADVPPAQLEALGLELKHAIRAKCEAPSLELDEPILVSVGSAAFPSQARTPEELLLLSYERAYLEKISRAGITIQLSEGHIGSAHRIAV